MPPHPLHPRSNATSTLFATTLLASFIVVGIPHVFPCPRPPRKALYDSEGRPVAKREKGEQEQNSTEGAELQMQRAVSAKKVAIGTQSSLEEEAALFRQLAEEAERLGKETRECPVPKPRGLIGRVMGFEGSKAVRDDRKSKDR